MGDNYQKRLEEYSESMYAALGRFIVKYEQACYSLQEVYARYLNEAGLSNHEVLNVIVFKIGAMTLCDKLGMLLNITSSYREQEEQIFRKKVLKNLINRMKKLIEFRNDVAHRFWFIGWGSGDETDFESVGSMKVKKHESDFKNFTKDDLEKSSLQLDELRTLIGRYDVCMGDRSVTFQKNFDFDVIGNAIAKYPK